MEMPGNIKVTGVPKGATKADILRRFNSIMDEPVPGIDTEPVSMEGADVDWEVAMSDRLGPIKGKDQIIDASRMRYHLSRHYNSISGMYVPPNIQDSDLETARRVSYTASDGRLVQLGDSVEPDTAHIIGNPIMHDQVQAHELRHRAFRHLSESSIRLQDALFSQTPEEWNMAVVFWRDRIRRLGIQTGQESLMDISMHEAEDALVKELTEQLADPKEDSPLQVFMGQFIDTTQLPSKDYERRKNRRYPRGPYDDYERVLDHLADYTSHAWYKSYQRSKAQRERGEGNWTDLERRFVGFE